MLIFGILGSGIVLHSWSHIRMQLSPERRHKPTI